ncbi:MAG: hypothetical protein U0836_09660 [Pirellulales bacterium]
MTTRLRVVSALAVLSGASFALTGVLLPAVTASRALAQDQAPPVIPAPTAAPAVSAASAAPAVFPNPLVAPAAPALSLPATVAVQATVPAPTPPSAQPLVPGPARAGNLYTPADNHFGHFGVRGRGPQPRPTLDPEEAAEAQRLVQEDSKLEGEVRSAVGQYHAAEKEADRNQLRAQLTDLLEKQFAARQQRRKLELASLEARVKKLREALEKRESAKQTIVERRLGDLLGDEDGLGWGDASPGFGGDVRLFQPASADWAPQPFAERR